jgi:hypothetical protein
VGDAAASEFAVVGVAGALGDVGVAGKEEDTVAEAEGGEGARECGPCESEVDGVGGRVGTVRGAKTMGVDGRSGSVEAPDAWLDTESVRQTSLPFPCLCRVLRMSCVGAPLTVALSSSTSPLAWVTVMVDDDDGTREPGTEPAAP